MNRLKRSYDPAVPVEQLWPALSLSLRHELAERHSKSLSNPLGDIERNVAYAALDFRHRCPVNVRAIREGLLRISSLYS